MSTVAKLITLEEYSGLDEPEEECATELVAGVVVGEPRPVPRHGRVQARLAMHLGNWAEERAADVTVESGYVISEDPATLRGPDVAVVLGRAGDDETTLGWTRGAPDVAVEVLSPSDTSSAMQRKILEYFGAGARLVWIVDPDARTVTAYRADGNARILRDEETLGGENVLCGFEVPVAKLFD